MGIEIPWLPQLQPQAEHQQCSAFFRKKPKMREWAHAYTPKYAKFVPVVGEKSSSSP
jgi:hypothetical protein